MNGSDASNQVRARTRWFALRASSYASIAMVSGPWTASSQVAVPASGTVADIDTAAVDRFVTAYRSRTGLPEATVTITRGNRVVYVAGYGASPRAGCGPRARLHTRGASPPVILVDGAGSIQGPTPRRDR